MKNKPTQFRQGDVFITRINKLPENLTPSKREKGRIILAHGEATGHAHAISEKKAKAFRDEADVSYLDIATALAEVQHEEHATVHLPRGHYRVIRQREYSPESIRNVAD